MKTVITLILLFTLVSPCFAELTENDIGRIRQVIRGELEPIKIEMAELKVKVSEMDKRINEKFKAVDDKISIVQASVNDKLSLMQWFIGGLVALVVAAIAIPQLLILYREKKESKEMDKLREAIAELKEKKVITP
ncbi:MAG: hypothetical protein ACE5PV_01860 [Candidatus Poribacteria bacterium]